jgi:hypothetical protein
VTARKPFVITVVVVVALLVTVLVAVLVRRGADAAAQPSGSASSLTPSATSPSPSSSTLSSATPTAPTTSVPISFDDGSTGTLLASGAPGGPVSLTVRPDAAPPAAAELVIEVSIDGRAPLPFPVTRSGATWTGTRVVPSGEWVVLVSLTADDGGFTSTITSTTPLRLGVTP